MPCVNLERDTVLTPKNPRLPRVTVAGRYSAIARAVLICFVILPNPVERQIIGGIHNRGRILAPPVLVLLICSSLHDEGWQVKSNCPLRQHVEMKCRVILIASGTELS